MTTPRLKRAAACLMMVMVGSSAVAQSPGGRWALAPYACDGELYTRKDTPLIVEPTMALHSQSLLWSAGYAALFALVISAGLI